MLTTEWPGQMAQWFGVPVVDPRMNSSNHMAAHNHTSLQFQGIRYPLLTSTLHFWPLSVPGTHTMLVCTCSQQSQAFRVASPLHCCQLSDSLGVCKTSRTAYRHEDKPVHPLSFAAAPVLLNLTLKYGLCAHFDLLPCDLRNLCQALSYIC